MVYQVVQVVRVSQEVLRCPCHPLFPWDQDDPFFPTSQGVQLGQEHLECLEFLEDPRRLSPQVSQGSLALLCSPLVPLCLEFLEDPVALHRPRV